jgi:hypothetical protein
LSPEQEKQARELMRQKLAEVAFTNASRPAPGALKSEQKGGSKTTADLKPINEQDKEALAKEEEAARKAALAAAQVMLEREKVETETKPKDGAPPETRLEPDALKKVDKQESTPTLAPANLTKRQRLDQLNADYRNDKLTPAEYHRERTRILSEP